MQIISFFLSEVRNTKTEIRSPFYQKGLFSRSFILVLNNIESRAPKVNSFQGVALITSFIPEGTD